MDYNNLNKESNIHKKLEEIFRNEWSDDAADHLISINVREQWLGSCFTFILTLIHQARIMGLTRLECVYPMDSDSLLIKINEEYEVFLEVI